MPSEIFPTHPARRRFLKQTLAFSALAALGSLDAPAFAGPSPHGAAEMLFIDPDECIDCGNCASVCEQNAIFPLDELPAGKEQFAEKNRAYFQ